MNPTIVYTDGACSGNPGPGGWAFAVPEGRWARGFDPDTTNQRMELMAVLRATEMLDGPLDVVTDSTYVANCFRDGWWKGWEKRGWLNSQKKPVANRDLWEPLIEAHKAGRFGVPRWVKGHSGDEWNDVVDRLAVTACQRGDDASGDSRPSADETAEADTPRGRPAASGAPKLADLDPVEARAQRRRRDGRIPAGTLLIAGGARETAADEIDALRRRLTQLFEAYAQLHSDLVVLSGLRPGAEAIAAEAALAAGVDWAAVLPWPNPQDHMRVSDRPSFETLLTSAPVLVVLEKKVPATRDDRAKSLARRDSWLAAAADLAVVVWDEASDDGKAFAHKLERSVGDDLLLIPPS